MYGKSNVETHITICKIDCQWKFAVWLRKLKQGLCINLEGWDEAGDGREVQKGRPWAFPGKRTGVGFLLQITEMLGGLISKPEGWYGEGGGFRMGNTCIPVVDSF